MAWVENSAMYWYDSRTSAWQKITDHNRSPISVDIERIETSNRMANGTMRRYVVAKKRSWSISWENLPSRRNSTRDGRVGISTVDSGWAGDDIESFHDFQDGAFLMRLRGGDDDGKAITDASIEQRNVMITSFTKEITKRGIVDLWSLSITLTEV